MAEVWQPRIGGNWITGRLCDTFAPDGNLTFPVYERLFAFYNTAWVLLTFTALIVSALSYFPALALGPLLEHLTMVR